MTNSGLVSNITITMETFYLLALVASGLSLIQGSPHYRYPTPRPLLTNPGGVYGGAGPVDPNPSYQYSYGISDPVSRVEVKAESTLQNGVTVGSYQYVRPDGVLQIVRYVVTPEGGYQADVEEKPGYAPPIPHRSYHGGVGPIGHSTITPGLNLVGTPRPLLTGALSPSTLAPAISSTIAPRPGLYTTARPLLETTGGILPTTYSSATYGFGSFRPNQPVISPIVNGHATGVPLGGNLLGVTPSPLGPIPTGSIVNFSSPSHSYAYKK